MQKNKIYQVIITFSFLFAHSNTLFAQLPAKNFETFKDSAFVTKPDLTKWNQLRTNFIFSVASTNDRIVYNQYPVINTANNISVEGWIGETVNVQLVVSTKKIIPSLKVTAANLTSLNGSNIIDRQNISVGYVYYVIADNTQGVCHKATSNYQNLITPEIIDFNSNSSFAESNTNRPVWINIKIPADAKAGTYKTAVTASDNQSTQSIPVTLTVKQKIMPDVSQRKFFLELWQYPVNEADYYKVKPWSDEHFNLMKPSMVNLQKAGESVITASFFWDQFNPTARDVNDMFIKVTKSTTGQYNYDFTNFDKWVNYMMGIGINKQITVFGMATLNYRMYYYDDATNKVTYFQQGINGAQYRQFWASYLKAFENHLKEKGWFDITTIGFSEKDLDVAVPLINFIKSQNKDWKISYSGKYFPQIQNDVYDYSVMSNQAIPDDVLAQRKQKNYITSFYTACWERFPNVFTISSPSDATWLAWNAAYRNMNGYLRWAYDYWPKAVLTDTRSSLASGDNFLIYPYGCSSIRFEMLKDGIEDFEKIMLQQNRQASSSPQLNSVLSQFDFKKVNANISRFDQIKNARASLNN